MSDNPLIRADGTNARAVAASIAAKQARAPKYDNQGRIIGTPKAQSYDAYGLLVPDPPAAP